MSWFYAEGGAQKGPVTDQEFAALVQAGRITATTLVWREGMADWQPYAAVHASAGLPPPAGLAPPLPTEGAPSISGPTAVCGECGKVVPAADTVQLDGRTICAACKPLVVQRMVEGVPQGGFGGPRALNPEAMLAALRARGGYDLDIGSIVSRWFEVTKKHFWPAVGVALLLTLVAIGCRIVPCAGIFVSWILQGAIMGGAFYYYLPKIRGQRSTVNDAFAGFRQPRMKHFMFTGMIIGAPQLVYEIVNLVVQIATFATLFSEAARGGQPPAMFMAMPATVLVVVLVMLPFMLVFWFLWAPSYVIVSDTDLEFWPAMQLSRALVTQRIGTWILFYLAMIGVSILCMLAICVGWLFAMPMWYILMGIAWDDIRRQAETAMAQPGAVPA